MNTIRRDIKDEFKNNAIKMGTNKTGQESDNTQSNKSKLRGKKMMVCWQAIFALIRRRLR